MLGPSDVFLILMPCERPGSVGDLVRIGVERIGAKTVPFGPPPSGGSGDGGILGLMRKEGVTSMLATASTALRLSEASRSDPCITGNMRTLLLSAEYVPPGSKAAIEANWGAEAFEHYGMTEMGLGGAMSCEARQGYHPREADLLFEIIDPATGAALGEGERGEVVFTTLTREAMPLIRYRTGDFSRWLPGRCPCGSLLKWLGRVEDRKLPKGY